MNINTQVAEEFVTYTETLSAGQNAATRRFVREFLSQSTRRRSVLLSEVARGLEESCRLLYSEKRLSRRLAAETFDEASLRRKFVRQMRAAVPSMPGRTVVAVDGTDFAKPRAREGRMPGLRYVWDGSRGETGLGYSAFGVASVGPSGGIVPLALEVEEPDRQEAKTAFFRRVVRSVSAAIPASALFVLDRGFDGRYWYESLASLGVNWAVRLKKNAGAGGRRRLYTTTGICSVDDAFVSCAGSEFEYAPLSRRRRKRPRRGKIRFSAGYSLPDYVGGAPRVPAKAKPLSVIFITGPHVGADGLTLLTNEQVRTQQHAAEIAESYRRRWVIEEGFRFIKQHWGLENFRPLTMRGIRRLVLLTLAAFGFLSHLRHHRPRLARRLQESSRAFGPVPGFCYYRLGDAVGAAMDPSTLREVAA